MTTDFWKLIDLLNTASVYLSEKHVENPRRNAEALLGKALSLPRIELYLQHDRPLREEEVRSFRDLIRRRVGREPLQQILGQVEFFGCSIQIVRGLLVPRPETEQLVQHVVNEARDSFDEHAPLRGIDLGCGSGCISVAVAKALPNIFVDGVDIDSRAVETTNLNARMNGVENRVRVFKGDLLGSDILKEIGPPYDVVISNPPYVPEADFESLAPEIRNFENPAALIGGSDGLKYFRRIAELLPFLLSKTGFAALEVGIGQAEAAGAATRKSGFHAEAHRDLNGIDRFVFIRTDA